ncbi:MAG: hypothetical protein KF866_08215 [Phycisphaeraceae bacterium]|nr:hypothetical protein [Phycisphaeraceae bacterium]MCW5753861.1 hypothetical protein [Phycisphaeraceae bacterium]
MKRTRLVCLALGAAALTGCGVSPSLDRTYGQNTFSRDAYLNESGRANVGYGDALGMAVFGKSITLAKARQHGDAAYAGFIESHLD